ncbi:hypothetical protein ACTFIZ_006477 [Dictyostelium cf. discoideum]
MTFLNKKPQILKNIEKDINKIKFKKSNKIKSDCNSNNKNSFIECISPKVDGGGGGGDDDNPWDVYTNIMKEEGFLKSCILDLNDGEVNSSSGISPLNVAYQEYQEIKNILEGNNSIYINCDSTRFFISNSNDLMISGISSNSLSFILRRTTNKCIIGIFQPPTILVDHAHCKISDIYNKITNFDKNERITNLIFSFSEDSLKNIVN